MLEQALYCNRGHYLIMRPRFEASEFEKQVEDLLLYKDGHLVYFMAIRLSFVLS